VNRHRRFEQMLAAREMLTRDEREQLAAHLTGCLACRQSAEAYKGQDRFFDTLRQEVPRKSALSAVLASSAQGRISPQLRVYHRFPVPRKTGGIGRPQRITSLAILAILGVAILSGVVYAAGSIIRVYHPEHQVSPHEMQKLFWIPSLPPYQTVHYRSLDPLQAARESGYAVAYLRAPPADINASVGVDVLPYVGWTRQTFERQPVDPALRGLAIAIRSVVRYRGSGHTVILLLNEPSPVMIKTSELVLGEHTIHLSDGREAWTSSDLSSALPFIQPRSGTVNTLAWVTNHYVVSLSSDLPEAKLRQLAVNTLVLAPKALASQRSIPSTWPTPLPLERLPGRLQAAVSGVVTYQQHGTKLTVDYQFNLASYGQGALYGLDKWHDISISLVIPRALQRHTHGRIPHQTFPGGNGGIGGNNTLTVVGMSQNALAHALRHGVTVRLTWIDNSGRRQQLFHFPFTPAASCAHTGSPCVGISPGQ